VILGPVVEEAKEFLLVAICVIAQFEKSGQISFV